jgi:hypothetical protein
VYRQNDSWDVPEGEAFVAAADRNYVRVIATLPHPIRINEGV